jgi:hypothetical protein
MCDKKMREKLNMHPVRNTHELWALAGFYSLAEEGRLEPEDAAREAATGANPGSAATKRGGSHKRRPPQFLAAEPSAPAGAKKKTQASEEVVAVKPATKRWCPVHESDEHNAYIFLLHHQLCRGTEEKCLAEQGLAVPSRTASAAIRPVITQRTAPFSQASGLPRPSVGATGAVDKDEMEATEKVHEEGAVGAMVTQPLSRATTTTLVRTMRKGTKSVGSTRRSMIVRAHTEEPTL